MSRSVALRSAGKQLTTTLLTPVLPLLTGKRIIIVPDGALQYVPFSALDINGADGALVPLISEHEITTVPSASAIAHLRLAVRNRSVASKRIALIGDPVFSASDSRVVSPIAQRKIEELHALLYTRSLDDLRFERSAKESGRGEQGFARLPFTRSEVNGIASLFATGDLLKALDFDANADALEKRDLTNYRILHFATHGLLNNQESDLSGLVLSLVDRNGRPQRGFLTLNDIASLRLSADLVVLSACQTALGKEIRGDGIVGLTEAFMAAGAAAVVSSLWKVDDLATGELMVRFYRALLDKKGTVSSALRAAQIHMWKEARWSDPYYWAGFGVHGDWQ